MPTTIADVNTLIGNPAVFMVIMVWTLVWKAFSLWVASQRKHRMWFVVLLVLNTVGILDIIYIVFFGKKKNESVWDAMKTLVEAKDSGKKSK